MRGDVNIFSAYKENKGRKQSGRLQVTHYEGDKLHRRRRRKNTPEMRTKWCLAGDTCANVASLCAAARVNNSWERLCDCGWLMTPVHQAGRVAGRGGRGVNLPCHFQHRAPPRLHPFVLAADTRHYFHPRETLLPLADLLIYPLELQKGRYLSWWWWQWRW